VNLRSNKGYIKQVEKRVLCELFWPVSQRVQTKVQKSVKWFETSRTNYQLNRFYGAYTVTVTLHETGTRNALLGSCISEQRLDI
jgi:hypothetical protein